MPTTYPAKIQPRDLQLLRGLFESRVMTLTNAAELHFGGSFEAAKKRVQKLKSAGLLAERARKRYQPSILHLTHQAFDVLKEYKQLDDYPPLAWQSMEKRARVSPMTIAHELSVLDVKTAITRAVRASDRFEIVTFQTWPLLFAFRARIARSARSSWVRPDGFLHIRERTQDDIVHDRFFYVEIDRSTETHETLCRRATGYRNHYRTGGFAVRLGRPRNARCEFPFRVLAIFRNAERRNNAAVALLRCHPPMLRQVWLTTDAVLADPLGPVWMRPLDYLAATHNSPFHPAFPEDAVYRRTHERETFVERTLTRHPLL